MIEIGHSVSEIGHSVSTSYHFAFCQLTIDGFPVLCGLGLAVRSGCRRDVRQFIRGVSLQRGDGSPATQQNLDHEQTLHRSILRFMEIHSAAVLIQC